MGASIIFNAITFYINMIKNNRNTPSSQDFLHKSESFTEKLLNELLTAQKELAKVQEVSQQQGPSYFVIAKLMCNLDKESWKEVCKNTLLEGWCAFELGSENTLTSLQMAYNEFEDSSDPVHILEHLLLAVPIFKHLEQEIERARRTNTYLTFAQLSLQDECVEIERAAQIMQAALKEHASDCDRLGILDTKQFALLLPGANSFKAQLILDDILVFCQEKELPLYAGIASHLGTANTAKDFLEHAHSALLEAQTKRRALCIYQKPSNPNEDRLTLVHSHEKRFLFGDSDEV